MLWYQLTIPDKFITSEQGRYIGDWGRKARRGRGEVVLVIFSWHT